MLRKLEWPFYLLSFYSFLEINVFCSTLYFIPWAMTPIFWGGVICFAPGEKSRPPLFFLQGNRKQKRKCLLLPKGESAETQSSTSSLQHFFTFIHETFRCCNAVTVMSRVLRGLTREIFKQNSSYLCIWGTNMLFFLFFAAACWHWFVFWKSVILYITLEQIRH